MAFAQIYSCGSCGDVWKDVQFHPDLYGDDDGDMVCRCGRVVAPKIVKGMPCWHALTEEEILEESGFYDQDPPDGYHEANEYVDDL